MSWGEQRGLVERFQAVTAFCRRQSPHWKLGSSYEGWVQALAREEARLLPLVLERLRRAMDALRPALRQPRWRAAAVDGALIICPRTAENQAAMGDRGKSDGMPLASLTVLFDLEFGLPWSFRVGPGRVGERTHLAEMLDDVPELLVADAGFLSYDLCRQLIERGKHFLLRVGGNAHLLSALEAAYEVREEIVYLWPREQQRSGAPALRLRLIKLGEPGRQPVYLLTDVLDPQALSDQEAGELYRQRWGEEVFYRTTKQTFEYHRLRSRTPENCYQELTWAVIGIWLLGLLSIEQLCRAGRHPRQWSASQSQAVVRRVLRGDPPRMHCRGQPHDLWQALRHCVKDEYERHKPKSSRNYPRKKAHPPPGKPRIQMATAAQIQRATQLPALAAAA